MTDPFAPFFAGEGVALLDGGLASELDRRGADLTDPLWSARILLDQPALIRDVHESYLAAGADILTTATYQASFEGLHRHGLGRREAVALFSLGVAVAREACEQHAPDRRDAGIPGALVAASIGPYGATLADGSEYRGDDGRSVRALVAFHQPRVETLLAAAPDLLAFETIPSGREAEAITRVLETVPEACAWVAFSCRDEERVADGTPFRDAVSIVTSVPALRAVGVNCTHPRLVASLLQSIESQAVPLVAYPNMGGTWDSRARCWLPEEDTLGTDFISHAPQWRAAGAQIIGGCCRTTPETIRSLAKTLRPDREGGVEP